MNVPVDFVDVRETRGGMCGTIERSGAGGREYTARRQSQPTPPRGADKSPASGLQTYLPHIVLGEDRTPLSLHGLLCCDCICLPSIEKYRLDPP
ncbi:unnamed protein product [Arctogadus glacialis]